jgi:hypothetical protein
MATPKERLQSIRELARQLLDHCDAGGDREHAFNLAVDTKALETADSELLSMLDCIEDELNGRND